MKRIFLLVFMFLMFVCAVNGESTEVAKEDTKPTQQPTAEELAYRADTATIMKIVKVYDEKTRNFRREYGDTQVQAEARERKLQEALARIIASFKGTILKLQGATLNDVNKDSEYKNGKWAYKYKATYTISNPNYPERPNDPNERKDVVPIEEDLRSDFHEYLSVKIVKTFPNEDSVINLRKGSVAPLTGTIRNISYDDGLMSIEID